MSEDKEPQTSPQSSRLNHELQDIRVQMFLGTIVKTIGRASLDVFVIWCLIWLIHQLFQSLSPGPQCVQNLFLYNKEPRCLLSLPALIQFGAFYIALFIGSFLSTRFKNFRKFQHSTMVTVFTMCSFSILLYLRNYPLSQIILLALAAFVVMFYGYKATFRKSL